jgi:hypothetical protein
MGPAAGWEQAISTVRRARGSLQLWFHPKAQGVPGGQIDTNEGRTCFGRGGISERRNGRPRASSRAVRCRLVTPHDTQSHHRTQEVASPAAGTPTREAFRATRRRRCASVAGGMFTLPFTPWPSRLASGAPWKRKAPPQQGFSEMDLSGHHSNPPAPLEALLNDASSDAEARREATENGRTCASGAPDEAVCAAHPRQGRIIDAISQVLIEEGDPMQAREVHARVETLLGEPVRWSSVKATLAGNLKGPDPRFVRVARGRYGVPPPPDAHSTDARPPTRPSRGQRFA